MARDKEESKLLAEDQQQLDSIKSKDVIGDIVKKSRTSVKGMVFGAATGLIVAICFQKNKPLFIIAGSLIGGLIGSKFIKTK